MQCKAAVFIKSINKHVRCGRCLACRIKFRNDWASRIYFEMLQHYHETGFRSVFITLTYRDEKLPCVPDTKVGTLKKNTFRS